ncbi:MAG: superoxide reductase [Clostridiales bacterium]|nr:superoxide reductase [Clostridiales bacterium]
MRIIGDLIQTGDWKGEKHVPVIHLPDKVEAGKEFDVRVSIGDAIGHPNTLEHHIAWFKVFFHAEGNKFPVEVATFNFGAHGEYDTYTEPAGSATIKTDKPGVVYAVSYCNIHGLWGNMAKVDF